jgi:cytoskeleton protein RodZ
VVLRRAREARGANLSQLSVLLKISERRLEAFEDGRWQDVGDQTFVRALAQSLCRHLGVDAASVLAALPAVKNEPHPQPQRGSLPAEGVPSLKSLRHPVRLPGSGVLAWASPVRLAVGVILLGALGLALAPSSWWTDPEPPTTAARPSEASASKASEFNEAPRPEQPASASSAIVASAPTPPPPAPAPAPAPVPVQAQAQTAPAPAPAASAFATAPLQLRAVEATWVQVTDATGQVLLSRVLAAGEQLGVEGGRRPLRLRVGNVAGTQARWLGQAVQLEAAQRSNVADVELP